MDISLSLRLSMGISLAIVSCWLTLNITLSICLSCWLTLNICCSWLIGIVIRCRVYISSSWISMYYSFMIIKMLRLIFLIKGCHVWVMIIIIIIIYLLRCALNIILLRSIKEIILLYLYRCSIYMNWGSVNMNWCSIYIYTTTFITISY